MANYDSGVPVSSSLTTLFAAESRNANTGIDGQILTNFDQIIVEVETFIQPEPIYRGVVGSDFVFSVGSPPSGASFITIVGYK